MYFNVFFSISCILMYFMYFEYFPVFISISISLYFNVFLYFFVFVWYMNTRTTHEPLQFTSNVFYKYSVKSIFQDILNFFHDIKNFCFVISFFLSSMSPQSFPALSILSRLCTCSSLAIDFNIICLR